MFSLIGCKNLLKSSFLSLKRSITVNDFLPKFHISPCNHMDAGKLFDEMPQRTHFPCNSEISSFVANGHYKEAIAAFAWTQKTSTMLDPITFAAVIKSAACAHEAILGRTIHGVSLKLGFILSLAVKKSLMDMYAKFETMEDSLLVFKEIGVRDSVSWNVLLSGLAYNRRFIEVMEWFIVMRVCNGDDDVKPTAITIAVVLSACAKLRALKYGQSLHACATKTGLEMDTLVGNALISFYSKCRGFMDDAMRVFQEIASKDVVSWNSIIAGYSENYLFVEAIDLFFNMITKNFQPNYSTVASILSICAFLELGWRYGKEIHCYAVRIGLDSHNSVRNALLTFYSNVGDMESSEFIFSKMKSCRDIVTWNTMLSGYAANGLFIKAKELFQIMLSARIKPDKVTLLTLLPVCAELLDIQEGKKIHAEYILNDTQLSNETSIGNALISFYRKCGEMENALSTFKAIPNRDLISWNSLLTVYSDNNRWKDLEDLYFQMCREGFRPDSVTILSLLQLCPFVCLEKVRETHGYSLRAGFVCKLSVGNAIIDAYSKCGSINDAIKTFRSLTLKNVVTGNTMITGYLKHGSNEDAEAVFEQMKVRDLTTWNLMVQIYANSGCTDQALDLFRELQNERMRPDTVTIINILIASVRTASVHLVRQCHAYKIRAALHDLHLEGALLHAYSKCGNIKYARKIFQNCSEKDIIIFTAMIGGYAIHSMAEEAIEVFCEMLRLGIKPDHVILTNLLSACSHSGLVDEGLKQFKSIKEVHGIELTMEHYACMVDLLARRGRLKEAYDFILDMPCEPTANVWGSLLGACKKHDEVEIGRIAADRLFDVEDGNIGNYVVMSNIYAADGRWERVEEVRRLMKVKDLKKPAGCSWIEVERTQHTFIAGDLSHPKRPSIYYTLKSLNRQIKEPLIEGFSMRWE